MIKVANSEGYFNENAEAKVCQDIVLKALAESSLSNNATIKGGVVMREISKDARRATQDMDIDFIRYSLRDDSIIQFIEKLNCIPGIKIEKYGNIEDLKQQDYHGKRVYIYISDSNGKKIASKIDLGVHKHLDINQEEFCFDIACFEDGANLLINSKEQMFTEKLRSLLKFGSFSTRYKDIFDMYYLTSLIDRTKLQCCLSTYIFDDNGMRENNIKDVCKRVSNTFSNKLYVSRLSGSRKNWLNIPVELALKTIINFLNSVPENHKKKDIPPIKDLFERF